MFRRSAVILLLLCLMASLSLAMNEAVAAMPPRQATPTMEHSTDDEHAGEHGGRIDAGDASIRIVAPEDGATIQGGRVQVQVETSNFPLGEGRHWHLYVDGKERGMSQGSSDTMAAADLEPGEHVIEAVLSTGEHQELDATDSVTIRVEAVAETAPMASDNSSLLVGGIVVAVLVLAGVAYTIARRS
ncbi:MAG TPA: hypothetical protein VFL17_15025 [Anaerolineae bacterium]|nr:hypothetical protein [Anaerolineae bacterium]